MKKQTKKNLCLACDYGSKGYKEVFVETNNGKVVKQIPITFCSRKYDTTNEICNLFNTESLEYGFDLTTAQRTLLRNYIMMKQEFDYSYEIDEFIKSFINGEITEEFMKSELKFAKAKERARLI